MATALPFLAPRIVDLRRVSSVALSPVLEDHRALGLRELGWDFTPNTTAIVNLVDKKDLPGVALRFGSIVTGFCYFILEDSKGIIGDLHLLGSGYRTIENENLLLEAALRELMRLPGIRRVEAQLLCLTDPLSRPYPFPEFLRNYQREVMELPLDTAFPSHASCGPFSISPWTRAILPQSGLLMARAYETHIDGRINDQYRSPAAATQFLESIVNQPGCGAFAPAASFAAHDHSGSLAGMSLASCAGPRLGHITQICVRPEARGMGLGRALIETSFSGLQKLGCERVSLSVTLWNQDAMELYRKLGFTRKRIFTAAVWEGFAVRH